MFRLPLKKEALRFLLITTETTNGETTTTEVAYAGADLDEVMEEVRANHPEVTIKKETQE